MEKKVNRMMMVAVLAVMVQGSMGFPCGSTFFSALVQLIPCRASVAPFSPIPPNDSCCSALRVLGEPCLCVLVNGPPISGVDRSMAMQLPEKCNLNFGPCIIYIFYLMFLLFSQQRTRIVKMGRVGLKRVRV